MLILINCFKMQFYTAMSWVFFICLFLFVFVVEVVVMLFQVVSLMERTLNISDYM